MVCGAAFQVAKSATLLRESTALISDDLQRGGPPCLIDDLVDLGVDRCVEAAPNAVGGDMMSLGNRRGEGREGRTLVGLILEPHQHACPHQILDDRTRIPQQFPRIDRIALGDANDDVPDGPRQRSTHADPTGHVVD
jgi:hypothetical protein